MHYTSYIVHHTLYITIYILYSLMPYYDAHYHAQYCVDYVHHYVICCNNYVCVECYVLYQVVCVESFVHLIPLMRSELYAFSCIMCSDYIYILEISDQTYK